MSNTEQSVKMSISISVKAYEKLLYLTDRLSIGKSGTIALALTRLYEGEKRKEDMAEK
jgi:hypothetical protein